MLGRALRDRLGVPTSKAAAHRTLSPLLASGLATALRERRLNQALTQEQVAASSQVSVQLIRRLEAGTSNPTLGTLHAVAATLETSVADLLARAGI